MPQKQYNIFLENNIRILVYFETDKGKIIKFVVKLEIYKNNDWFEIERYDTHHGYVHKDVLNKMKEKIKVIIFELLDNKIGLNIALKDFKENYNLYLWRLENEKQ